MIRCSLDNTRRTLITIVKTNRLFAQESNICIWLLINSNPRDAQLSGTWRNDDTQIKCCNCRLAWCNSVESVHVFFFDWSPVLRVTKERVVQVLFGLLRGGLRYWSSETKLWESGEQKGCKVACGWWKWSACHVFSDFYRRWFAIPVSHRFILLLAYVIGTGPDGEIQLYTTMKFSARLPQHDYT
jgi:hypothetical protein